MGGCTASKLEHEDDVVSLCRERKRLLKSALDRRYVLADAHCRYIHSLFSVAAAIRLFVARHTSSSSPFLIALPPPPASPPPSSPISKQNLLIDSAPAAPVPGITCRSTSSSSTSSSSSGDEGGEEVGMENAEMGCGFSCSGMGEPLPPMLSPPMDFAWDFFNPFEGVRVDAADMMTAMGGLSRSSDEDLRVVREEEGIPDLEEEEEEEEKDGVENEDGDGEVDADRAEMVKVVNDSGKGEEQQQNKGLTVIDAPEKERELMEALKDIEDHFIRAYDSGKEVSRMLEANRVHLHSSLEEIKENSSKLIQAITWHRSSSSSSQASSHKSYLTSSSKDGTWTQYNNDLFDDHGGMESGSHSLTLGRLYAWEKKLFDEVKAGNQTCRLYEKKCAQLRNQDARGDDPHTTGKTRASVKDLYTRVWVALRTAEAISNRIQKLRDEELHPQILELLKGLKKTWRIMLESHETQHQIMFEVKSFTNSSYGRFSSDTHRHATLQLEAELQNWRACFIGYIAAQRSYVEALDGWLSKFIIPEVEFYSRGRSSVIPYRVGAPPLIIICHDWLSSFEKLPDRAVAYALKGFSKDVKALWVQQGEEQQQKRKVDGLAKELDRKVLAFQKAEDRILESKLSETKGEPGVRQRVEYLAGRKDLLDLFRKRLNAEKVKHHECMQETQRIMLNGFQKGLTSLFESLTDFSKASLNTYDELVMYSEKANAADENNGKPSCIEGCQVDDQ